MYEHSSSNLGFMKKSLSSIGNVGFEKKLTLTLLYRATMRKLPKTCIFFYEKARSIGPWKNIRLELTFWWKFIQQKFKKMSAPLVVTIEALKLISYKNPDTCSYFCTFFSPYNSLHMKILIELLCWLNIGADKKNCVSNKQTKQFWSCRWQSYSHLIDFHYFWTMKKEGLLACKWWMNTVCAQL